MDAKQFLAEFGHIVSAPGGIQRVRELVLQLAISGDLFPRIPEDIDALHLYAANQEEKVRLISLGELKRQPDPAKLTEHDQPWQLPEGWYWCRLGEVTDYGHTLKAELEDVKDQTWVLELEDIEKGTSRLIQRVLARDRRFKSTKNKFSKGAILYGKLRPYLDKVLIADEDGVCTTEIVPISFFGGIEPGYLRWYLKSPFFIAYASNLTHGMNLPRLGTDAVRNSPFPFPPAQEQKRIVAKVDELMALCDKLEAQQQEREGLCTLTRAIMLDALASSDTTEHLSKAWTRLKGDMKLLFDSPESVEDFRNTILRLAVWGRLTKRTGANAKELLEHCRRHKETLVAEGKVKREKPQKPFEDQPVRLPENWTWARFSEIGLFARGKSKHRPRNDLRLFSGGQYPFVQTGDVSNSVGKGIYTFSKSYNEIGLKQSKLWPTGTLCITIAANIAESAILKIDACFPDSVVGFLPFEEVGNVEYFDIFVRTAKQELTKYAPSTAQKNINLGILEQVAVPLPPKEEIEEIVNTAGKLLLMCDRLEQELLKVCDVGIFLAASAVSSITGIRIEDKEKMKVPKTELVANLRLGLSPTNGAHAPLTAILVRNQGELSAKALWNNSGLEIDAFYQQLKTEMAKGWIVQPEVAYVREVEAS